MSTNEWQQIEGTGEPGDQERDLDIPGHWAQVGPEGPPRGAWSWTVLGPCDQCGNDEIAGGYAGTEDDAKHAVADWEAANAQASH